MHEYGIALEIIDAVQQESRSHDGTVKSVTVEVGELSMVNPRQLQFSWQAVIQGTPLSGAELKVDVILGEAECECGYTGRVNEPLCPECGEAVLITRGRDLVLKRIEVES